MKTRYLLTLFLAIMLAVSMAGIARAQDPAHVYTGPGSPEGVLAGNPGDVFISSDGPTYLKNQGTGKTGWVVQSGNGSGDVSTTSNATFGPHTYDFSGVTLLKMRFGAGLTASTNGDFGYDTTNSNWHGWNGADALFAPLASGFASGHCGQPTSTSGKWVIADTGATCGTASMVYPGAGVAVSTGAAWGTSLAAPSGSLVGTTDVQSLTNKTLDGITPTVLGYVDPSSSIQTQLNAKAPLASPTFTGKTTTAASAVGGAGFNLPHGSAPTTPVNGDLWTTLAGLYAQVNGSTVGPFGTGGGGNVSNSGSPTPGQAAEFVTDALHIQGVGTAGGGASYLKATIASLSQGQQLIVDNTPKLVNAYPGVVPNAQVGTTYTIVQADNTKYLTFSNAASIAVTLNVASSYSANFVFVACDIGAGTATITPTTSTISYTNGGAYTSGATSLALTAGQCATVYSDTSNYFAVLRIGGSMVYPGAGVSNSTGSAWGTSYTVGTGANNLVQLNASSQLPAVSAALLTNFPTLNQNTSGTAANLSGSPALPNGTTGTTQAGASNDTKLATDTYVDAHFIGAGTATLATAAISSATCATAVTVAATGVATTDVITAGFNGDPTAVTGYVPLTTGMLTIIPYPTSGNVNFKVCNNTSASITPGAITLNWKVTR